MEIIKFWCLVVIALASIVSCGGDSKKLATDVSLDQNNLSSSYTIVLPENVKSGVTVFLI